MIILIQNICRMGLAIKTGTPKQKKEKVVVKRKRKSCWQHVSTIVIVLIMHL